MKRIRKQLMALSLFLMVVMMATSMNVDNSIFGITKVCAASLPVYTFNYTGGVQSVTLPAGVYKLEVWGAQGGTGGSYGAGTYGAGGSGYIGGVFNGSTTRGVRAGNGLAVITTLAIPDVTPPTLAPTANPTALTNGIVTVTANAADYFGVATTKWLAGTHAASDFAVAGTVFTNSFTVSSNGTYTVYAADAVGNTAVSTITISNICPPPTISLVGSPTAPTKGNVTVTATVNATGTGNSISVTKWASGTQTVGYFGSAGTAFTSTFQVSASGTYTVYAKDTLNNEIVNTINIPNIDRTAPTIAPAQSPLSPTNVAITITANAADASGIAETRWLVGEKTLADFAEGNGTAFTDTFDVSANGTYTIYAIDNAGMRQ